MLQRHNKTDTYCVCTAEEEMYVNYIHVDGLLLTHLFEYVFTALVSLWCDIFTTTLLIHFWIENIAKRLEDGGCQVS